MEIEYYGTNLISAGHDMFILGQQDLKRNLRRLHELPFNAESLPWAGKGREFNVGVVRFYNFAGFTICAISGAPSDNRSGSKSIFFVESEMTPENFKTALLHTPMFNKIIAKMPFEVKM